jgi:hypothetical protein
VENMTITEAIKKLLEIAGFKDNKKSVSEINTLRKKRNNLIFEEEQNVILFNQLYNNICNLYKQVKSIENRSIYHQFILDFCDKSTTMCLKYNDENLKYLKNIEKEFEMCLNEFFKYYKNLKIVRSDFDVFFTKQTKLKLTTHRHHAGTQPRLRRMEASQLQCEGASVRLLHPESRQ